MVELYEFLLKCSCDLAQEAPPPRKFRMSGRRPHKRLLSKAPDAHIPSSLAGHALGLCSAANQILQLRLRQHTDRYGNALNAGPNKDELS